MAEALAMIALFRCIGSISVGRPALDADVMAYCLLCEDVGSRLTHVLYPGWPKDLQAIGDQITGLLA